MIRITDIFIFSLLIGIASTIECFSNVVVIVPSFNNATCYKANLDSIFCQDYPHYRVIYIDDCSTDGTGNLVELYILQHHLEHKVTLIRNSYNCKALANIWHAVWTIYDDELVVILDGDDAFAHSHVISRIEQIHREKNMWVSYAQFMNVPEHKAREAGIPTKGYAYPTPIEVINKKSYRLHPWSWSGLRSFYAWIFKQIKLEDLLSDAPGYEGKFYPICYDNAIMFPLMEMAGHHCTFIDEVLLLRNLDTPLNDFKVNPALQRATAAAIRKKAIYPTIQSPIICNHSAQITTKTTIAEQKETLCN